MKGLFFPRFLCLAVLSLGTLYNPCYAQFHSNALPSVNSVQRIGVTQKPESEIHAAINPLDENNLLVAGMRYHPVNPEINLSFSLYRSHDLGERWIENSFDATALVKPIQAGGDPVLAFDRSGVAHFVWLMYKVNPDSYQGEVGIYYANSIDQGASWDPSLVPIVTGAVEFDPNSGQTEPLSQVVDKPWLTVDDTQSPYQNNLYVLYYSAQSQNLGDQHLYCLRKEVRQSQFSQTPVRINSVDYEDLQFATADVTADGALHVCFWGKRFGSSTALYHSVSHDGGRHFGAETRISTIAFPTRSSFNSFFPSNVEGVERLYPAPQISVDTSEGKFGGNLYVVWNAYGTDSFATEGLDIYFSRSEDGGNTWSLPYVINNDSLQDIHQHHPSLAVSPEGILVVTWYDRRIDPTGNQYALYYTGFSTNGGLSFDQQFPVSELPLNFRTVGAKNFGFGIGEYNQVLASSSYAISVWADGIEDGGTPHIYSKKTALPKLDSLLTNRQNPLYAARIIGPYPNPLPSRGISYFQVISSHLHAVHWKVEDLQGRILRQNRSPIHKEVALSLIDFPSGIYFLRIETPSGKAIAVKKLIVP